MALDIAGLGIGDEPSLHMGVIRKMGDYDMIFLELYTSPTLYTREDVKSLVEREVYEVNRRVLEEGSDQFLNLCKAKNVLLLVPGDPLTATTHKSLVIEARRNGIDVRIYHNTSIYTAAIGEAGLDIYRVGASGTIMRGGVEVNMRNHRILNVNYQLSLHTFYFLEYSREDGYVMDVYEGIEELSKDERSLSILDSEDTYIIGMTWVGTTKQQIRVFENTSEVDGLPKKAPSVIVIAANPHFTEKEYLLTLKR